MKKAKRPVTQSEIMRNKWKRRIVSEKGYTEKTAGWMAQRMESLLDYMLYGHAVIAYYKQNGEFKFVKATLFHYENDFRKTYDPAAIESAVAYWNVEEQGWRTFQLENFLEWKPCV